MRSPTCGSRPLCYKLPYFPIITPGSPRLAEAAECAHDRGAFWEFYDRLFALSPIQPSQMFEVVAQPGLDVPEFERCFESRRYSGTVQDQLYQAASLGFRGTPSFMVDDTPLAGPAEYGTLIAIIESAPASNS